MKPARKIAQGPLFAIALGKRARGMDLRVLAHRWVVGLSAIVMVSAASLVLATGGPAAGAPAVQPALSASTTNLDFGEVTLGDYAGPMDVTLTNTSASSDQVTGYDFEGDNDFLFDNEQDQCAQALAPGGTCVLEFDFNPGALGTRTLTLSVIDSANSGLTISMTGVGGIGYYQVSDQGLIGYAGDAAFYGDLSDNPPNEPIVGMAPTVAATGWSPPTAASSPSATPTSTARPAASV